MEENICQNPEDFILITLIMRKSLKHYHKIGTIYAPSSDRKLYEQHQRS